MIIAQSAAVSIGFVLDAIFGDPDFKLHPIRLIGYLISFLEKVMRRIFPKNERLGGAVMAICVLIICGGVPFAILFFAYRLNYFFGIAIESVICYFMLAAKSLKQAGMSVYKPLKNGDVDGARKSVSMIVGRDTESLDDIGITKAAVETVAENTSDGVIAPLIYMAIGGGVLGCVYKAINTMDSMVGYKNDRYINFGRFAAKLDDIANYIPSRISAYLMIFASKLWAAIHAMRTEFLNAIHAIMQVRTRLKRNRSWQVHLKFSLRVMRTISVSCTKAVYRRQH